MWRDSGDSERRCTVRGGSLCTMEPGSAVTTHELPTRSGGVCLVKKQPTTVARCVISRAPCSQSDGITGHGQRVPRARGDRRGEVAAAFRGSMTELPQVTGVVTRFYMCVRLHRTTCDNMQPQEGWWVCQRGFLAAILFYSLAGCSEGCAGLSVLFLATAHKRTIISK